MITTVSPKKDGQWLAQVLEGLRCAGVAVINDVLAPSFVEITRETMYRVQRQILEDVGAERLRRAGELGILRCMFKYDPHFFEFLRLPEVLAVVDHTVSETAVLHLQNGFILPSFSPGSAPSLFQTRFHMDFPRVLNGSLVSVNLFFAIDEFKVSNGATLVVPGSHQKSVPPEPEYLRGHAVALECPAGSIVVFDSTLWHASGANTSGGDRLAINHQFTRSYFKQQLDYVRALGDRVVTTQPSRTQQLLGWYTRVPTSLDEYYRPETERLYRKGQG